MISNKLQSSLMPARAADHHCGPQGTRGTRGAERQLMNGALDMLTAATKLLNAQLDMLGKSQGAQGGHCGSTGGGDVFGPTSPGCPCPPSQSDSSHPAGSLKVDDKGVITTPGGYQIEATDKFNWQITGPDGKKTEVWGDPHVKEGDGGKWDFKRDSTFVLGDGTRINVDCVPYGNGATVTGKLDITSGNDRVQVTDIDKGKGKVGQVTQDGYQHVNDFGGNDVFVMGKESDDWSLTGKEIIGSENQGEKLKLGNDLAPGAATQTPATQTPATQTPATKPASQMEKFTQLFQSFASIFNSLQNLGNLLNRHSSQNTGIVPPQNTGIVPNQGTESATARRSHLLERSFAQIGRMLDTLTRFQNLNRGIETGRNQWFQA